MPALKNPEGSRTEDQALIHVAEWREAERDRAGSGASVCRKGDPRKHPGRAELGADQKPWTSWAARRTGAHAWHTSVSSYTCFCAHYWSKP